MSCEIIKSISFRNNEVKITSYCNNVFPKIAENSVCKQLTKILQSLGKEEAEKQILLQFWKGIFKGKSTNYGKFIESYFDRNSRFNWGNVGKTEELGTYKYGEKVLFSYEDIKSELFLQYLKFLEESKKQATFLKEKILIAGKEISFEEFSQD